LEVIRQLKQSNNIPIQQAQMRVQLTIPGKKQNFSFRLLNNIDLFVAKDAKKFKEKMNKLSTAPHIDNEEFLGSSMQLICSIDPGVFRELDDLLSSETRGQGQLELLSLMDVAEGDETFNDLHDEKTDE
jgi:ribosome maturation protein SDO1